MTPDRPRPILDHLRELRRRATWAVLFTIGTTVTALVFYEPIFRVLLRPAGNRLNPSTGGKLVFQDVTEAWATIAKIGFIVGIATALPFIVYQVIAFVNPGLKPSERRWLYVMVPGALASFAAGAVFGYFVLIPPAIRFLLTIGGTIAEPLIRIGSYVSLVIMLMFWMGMIFELPLTMFFLAKVGIVKSRWVAKQRKWALLLAFVLGAVITPTADPVNQALVAGPILVMFEFGLWLARLAERMRSQPQTETATGQAST
jgi:sec-independent protein translocase protein TatC